jgi:4-carboxymuconolactone decarboxylase
VTLTPSQHEEADVDSKRYEEGLSVRRAVLGTEYVDEALESADELTRPLQNLITEFAWGEVWTRPGLPRKTRSLINLAMLTALNRPHELRLHLRGALNNGCTKEEIREVLLQTFIYCGAPAAIDSFRIAKEVFAESDGLVRLWALSFSVELTDVWQQG